jgi:hypothetical protein
MNNIQLPTFNTEHSMRRHAVLGRWALNVERSLFSRFFCAGVISILILAKPSSMFAQSNEVPGPTAYSAFGRFITTRNIFDPNRYARDLTRPVRTTRVQRSAPTFTLVGTMSYEKGLFAFFDGNDSDLKKVLYSPDTNGIAGFVLTEITPAGVTLETADKKRTLQLKIGDSMRQEGKVWQPTGTSESTESSLDTATDAGSSADNSSTDSGSAPGSAGAPNDILKKLMEQREKELK